MLDKEKEGEDGRKVEDKGYFHIGDEGTITTNYNTKDVLDYRTPRSIIDNEWKAQRIVNDTHGEGEREGKGVCT